MEGLKEVAKEDRSALFKADHNGWRPLHEAARGGKHKVLEYLIEEGTSPTNGFAPTSSVIVFVLRCVPRNGCMQLSQRNFVCIDRNDPILFIRRPN